MSFVANDVCHNFDIFRRCSSFINSDDNSVDIYDWNSELAYHINREEIERLQDGYTLRLRPRRYPDLPTKEEMDKFRESRESDLKYLAMNEHID